MPRSLALVLSCALLACLLLGVSAIAVLTNLGPKDSGVAVLQTVATMRQARPIGATAILGGMQEAFSRAFGTPVTSSEKGATYIDRDIAGAQLSISVTLD